MIPLIILGVVLLLIIVRTLIKIKLEIWLIMLVGAVAALITLQITPIDALYAIDFDVIILLFCMFIVGNAMNDSGYLLDLAHHIFRFVYDFRNQGKPGNMFGICTVIAVNALYGSAGDSD